MCTAATTIITVLVIIAIIAVAAYLAYGNRGSGMPSFDLTAAEEHFACGAGDSPDGVRANVDGPAPIDYTMGEYDGLPLRTECPDCWKHAPCGAALLNTTQNHTVQGNQLPLQLVPTANDFPNAPPVDGCSAPRDDFMFAYNQSSPECCPATYSTSTGCVCTTPEQRKWLQRRGGNNAGYAGEF